MTPDALETFSGPGEVEPSTSPGDTERTTKRQREISRLESRALDFLHAVFMENAEPDERVNKLKENLEHFYTHLGQVVDVEDIRRRVEACRDLTDEAAFVDQAFQAVQPLIAHQVDHPDIARQIFHERHNFTQLNEVLSYGLAEEGTVAHIHLAPATDIANLRTTVIDGLCELARRMKADPVELGRVGRVAASSWIIAEHPRIMERLGFTIDGPISEAGAQRALEHGETRPSLRAHIDRDDFLNTYG